jgi:hypothetical protein
MATAAHVPKQVPEWCSVSLPALSSVSIWLIVHYSIHTLVLRHVHPYLGILCGERSVNMSPRSRFLQRDCAICSTMHTKPSTNRCQYCTLALSVCAALSTQSSLCGEACRLCNIALGERKSGSIANYRGSAAAAGWPRRTKYGRYCILISTYIYRTKTGY